MSQRGGGVGSAGQVHLRKGWGLDSKDAGTPGSLELTRDSLTIFTLTVGLRIDCRGVGTRQTDYCNNLGRRSGLLYVFF